MTEEDEALLRDKDSWLATMMGRPLWYNLDHEPISVMEAEELIGSISKRHIRATAIDDQITVSTVFLVLDHGLDDGPPVLYETMVFHGDHGEECWRWTTREEAEEGHDRVVEEIRAKVDS